MTPLAEAIHAQSAVLVSVLKPLVALAVFTGWGAVVGLLDKDADYFYVQRRMWSAIHIAAGILAVLLLGAVPIFAVSLILALLVLAGDIAGYVLVRNTKVPKEARWTWDYRSVLHKYEKRQQEKAVAKAPVKLLGKDEAFLEIPMGEDPQAKAFQIFTETMEFAVPRNAQKVEFTVSKEASDLRVWLDGVEYKQVAPEPKLALEVINFLKARSGMDVAEVRRKQTGKLFVQIEGYGRHQLLVSSIGTTRSISLNFEIDADKRKDVPFEFMGYTEAQKADVGKLWNAQGRVVLIATPSGHGGTTTLYSLAKKHDAYTTTVMFYERQTTLEMEGAKHVKYPENGSNEQIDTAFAALLRSEPSVMVLPNGILDAAMATNILAESEAIRFYIPIPAKDTLSALQAWQSSCGDPKAAANAMGGVVSERLLRRLCHTCRVSYQPDREAMRKLNLSLPADGVLYKASGKVVAREKELACPDCLGVGYKGRIGAFEVLVLDNAARAMLAGGRLEELRVHLRKSGMKTLQESALAHVASGVTDVSEVTRVLNAAA